MAVPRDVTDWWSYIDYIRLIDTINTIGVIAAITNIVHVDNIDLIDEITTIGNIGNINLDLNIIRNNNFISIHLAQLTDFFGRRHPTDDESFSDTACDDFSLVS